MPDSEQEMGVGVDTREDAAPVPPLYTRIRYSMFLLVSFFICVLVRDGAWGGLSWLPFSSSCAADATPEPTPPATPLPTVYEWPGIKEKAKEAVGHAGDAAAGAASSAFDRAKSALDDATGNIGEKISQTAEALCSGHALVYRFSFALVCFYFVHMVLQQKEVCCVDDSQKNAFQAEFFCIKTAVFVVLLIATIWIPNGFFATYAKVCLVGSGVFLVLQVVLLIDFVYDWNDSWARKADDEPRWGCYLITFTALFYLFSVVLVILMYVWFTQGESCDLNGFFITTTLLAGLIGSGLSIKMPHGSIFVASAVFAYTAVLCFSAIKNGSTGDCNALESDGTHITWSLVLSSLFVGTSVAWAAASAGASRGAFTVNDIDTSADEDTVQSGNYFFFHLVMMLGSMYMAMLLTNWGDAGGEANPLAVASGSTSMWVKILSEWLSIFAFMWSLVAPVTCCKDREFEFA